MLVVKKLKKTNNNGKKFKIKFSKKLSIELIFFILILYLLLRFVEIKEFIKLIFQIKWSWFFLALFAQFLSFLFFALFKHELLKEMKEKISIAFLTKLSVAMAFIDIIIPSQSISGHVFLFKALGKKKINKGKRSIIMITNFLMNYIVFFSLLALSIIYSIFYFKNLINAFSLILFSLFLIFLLLLLVFFYRENSRDLLISLNKKIPKLFKLPINKFIKNFDKRFELLVRDYYKERKRYKFQNNRLLLLTFLSYFSRILVLLFVVLSLNYYLTFDKILIIYVLASIISFISYLRLGFFEAGLTLALLGIGLNYNLALATTIVFRVINLWLPLFFGYFFTRRIIRADI